MMFGLPQHRRDVPIISSLADVDFYKFTMAYFVWKYYRGVTVTYGMTNRTRKVRLAEVVDIGRLREELEHIKTLQFNLAFIAYLRGMNVYGDKMFDEDFLRFLETVTLPDFQIEERDGQFGVVFEGPWEMAIWWETLALSVTNELYYRSLMRSGSVLSTDLVYATGVQRLNEKIQILKDHPFISIVEFGTRRRFSGPWQFYVIERLLEELGPRQLMGTSNTEFAWKTGLTPMGTNAHELQMVAAALAAGRADPEEFATAALVDSQRDILRKWWGLYGFGLSVALTDTFGTDAFFRDFGGMASEWKGLRQDSGDPFIFAEQAIRFYRGLDIDPAEKLIIFSDGLDLDKILALQKACAGRIRCSFGWGTNLTNDMGLGTLSLVVKAIAANGLPTVKLSDNLAKAMGRPEVVEAYRQAFRHTNTFREECKV